MVREVGFTVSVYGVNGNIVSEYLVERVERDHITLDLSGLKRGLYLIDVLGENGLFRGKIIKE